MNVTERPAASPTPAAADLAPADPGRRRWMARVSLAAGGLIAAAVGAPAVGMFLGPMVQRLPEPWRPVGPLDQYPVGSTTLVSFETASPVPWSGQTGQMAAWLRRVDATQLIAFSVNCAHLGCPVRWEAGAQLFLCPCHGGAYYADGSVAAGPPPHALVRYPVRINAGQVEIQASPLPV